VPEPRLVLMGAKGGGAATGTAMQFGSNRETTAPGAGVSPLQLDGMPKTPATRCASPTSAGANCIVGDCEQAGSFKAWAVRPVREGWAPAPRERESRGGNAKAMGARHLRARGGVTAEPGEQAPRGALSPRSKVAPRSRAHKLVAERFGCGDRQPGHGAMRTFRTRATPNRRSSGGPDGLGE